MRTLLLSEGLQKDFHIIYLSRELEGSQNHLIEERGFELKVLRTMECEEMMEAIKSLSPALCIVDHYEITPQCEEKIRSLCKLLVFDDDLRPHNADIVLNHSIFARKNEYDYLSDTVIFAGSDYTLLKPGFVAHQNRFIPIRHLKNKKVLIALGGTDVLNLSLPIKKALLNLEKSLHIDIVTTSANPRLKHMKHKEKNIMVDISDMATLMASYDLILTSASTSLLETFALKKPFIAVQCASNQAKTVDMLRKAGLGNSIKRFNPALLKKALSFVQYRPQKIERVLSGYRFSLNGAAKEITQWLK